MQTKKKLPARNIRDHASPRVSRAQKKMSESVQVAEKIVAELITSSPRKQKCGGIPKKKSREAVTANNMNPCYIMQDDVRNVLGYDRNDEASVDAEGSPRHVNLWRGTRYPQIYVPQGRDQGTAQCMLETIFSPTFHIPKDVGGGIDNAVDFIKFFRSEDENVYQGGIQDSQADILKTYAIAHSSMSVKKFEQKLSHQDERLSAPTTCSSDMDVDTSTSSAHTDVHENGSLMPPPRTNTTNSFNEEMVGANLSSEVSEIYLAMQQSKLECIDEANGNSLSANIYVEPDDVEEIDYFDPYLFIKNLPDLSSVVPTYRPTLLPKQTRSCPPTTLVLDLDETLVHSTLEPCDNADFTFAVNFNLVKHTVYVRCRPHLKDFMERVASLFEIIIFTASQSIYAEQLLNILDPKRKIFRHRVYRDSCVFVEGNYLKDLSVLGRDLARVIIIDNSPQTLVGVEDVRPLIAKKFNLREKIAAAVYPSLHCSKGDPFERQPPSRKPLGDRNMKE
ncbi:hypothetical protein IFM89_017109 [Coptis chinensis]|uniref:FCP1 homology domain-containing protein n=1 Tax=Coptis chinensis TaxID=261450 RepID=A0A835HLK4_9MAGN|nr:hypothetical protein IFM89_017109 [Coptis chinensis]